MQIRDIKTEQYLMQYDESQSRVVLKGSFRFFSEDTSGSQGYQSMINMLNDAVGTNPPKLTIDMRELEFLNSSGINAMCKFVISLRQRGGVSLVILGSRDIAWQGKSLNNLKRLMPGMELVL